MEQLSEDFERRVREKEEEQLSLKKELASLAIKMNMEAQKKRHQQVDAQRYMCTISGLNVLCVSLLIGVK